jgi:sterol 3beta-glucosyltransferase
VEDKNEVVKGFADLVAVDLDSPQRAIAGRLAKLTVTGDSLTDTPSPESSGSDSDTEESSPQDEDKKPSLTPGSSTADGEVLELTPDEIVDLLVQEFGPLTAEGEEEKLLIEKDGAWLHDVVILVCVKFLSSLLLVFISFITSGGHTSDDSSFDFPRLPFVKSSRSLTKPASDQSRSCYYPPQGLAQKIQGLVGVKP